ncbi:ParA family protein [Aerococcus urinaeequi]|uniref:ParA family protein n=1 Tax=Aerococcus urinaeequi TaxID=51665 RepID=UPI003D6A149A
MVITPSNFKGGVGKTTTSLLLSYILTKHKGKKVLVIDTDPQENLTYSISTTFKKSLEPNKNVFNACFDDSTIEENIQNITNNLDLLAGEWKMTEFETEANRQYKQSQQKNILSIVISPIMNDYDYIIIDTSPYINLVMDNVIHVTDYVVITTQTDSMAFESTKRYYDYLLSMANNTDFKLLGVLPYLVGDSSTDKYYLQEYNDVFGDELFNHKVKHSDRVKTWNRKGITEDKPYDKKTLAMYENVVDEMLEKM